MNGRRGLAIAVAASLVVGVAIGLVAGIAFMRFGGPLHGRMGGGSPMEGPEFGPMGMGPGARVMPRPLLAHLDRELNLTPQQHERILAALENLRQRHLALRDSTHAAIERELTDAQRTRWRALLTHYRQSWHGRSGRPLHDDDEGRRPGAPPEPGEGR